MATLYPVRISVDVLIVGDGDEGKATYTCTPFKAVDEDELKRIVDEVVEQLPDGYRLMTRHEAFMYNLREVSPLIPTVALPSLDEGEVWHDPETEGHHLG